MSHQLSGGAVDTLFVLFWFGPREAGEIPAKSGETELASLGFCKRVDVKNVPKGRDTHLCVLTEEGYKYAYLKYVSQNT